MIGYESQRQEVYRNTLALLSGHSVNNILLYGDSGTGKSATVKSMLHKRSLSACAWLKSTRPACAACQRLSGVWHEPLKFVIFIDDLSFEDGDQLLRAQIILEEAWRSGPPM